MASQNSYFPTDRERETQTPQRGDNYLFYPYFSSDRNLCFVCNYYLNAIEGGHTHMLLQETGAKKGCGRRGEAGGGNPQGMPFLLPAAIAWLHDQ